MQFIPQPFSQVRLGEFLLTHLADPQWTAFRAAIAFVKRSGTRHIRQPLLAFSNRAEVRISSGIDFYGTSREGLVDLLQSTPGGQVFVYRNNGPYTFHPKIYLFKSNTRADLVVGSGNLTGGGLFTNYEASLAASLDLTMPGDIGLLQSVEATLDSWSQPEDGRCHLLSAELIEQLEQQGYVRTEAQLVAAQQAAAAAVQQQSNSNVGTNQPATPSSPPLFSFGAVPPAPVCTGPETASLDESDDDFAEATIEIQSQTPEFTISILQGDLASANSSREIRITKHIRDQRQDFWGWPNLFTEPDENGQRVRNVRIRYGQDIIDASLKDYPAKKPDGVTKASADFRLSAVAAILADVAQEDDLVVLSPSTEPNIDYNAQVVRVNDPNYEEQRDGIQEYTKAKSTTTGTFRKYKYLP